MAQQYEVIHIPEIERRNNVIGAALGGLENSVANMQPVSANVSNLFESKSFGIETEPVFSETVAELAVQDELSEKRRQVEESFPYDIAA